MSKKDKIETIEVDDIGALPELFDGRHKIMPIVTATDSPSEQTSIPEVIPILALRTSVLFPGSVTPITVGREKSIRLIKEVNSSSGILGAVLQREGDIEDPAPDDLYKVGTAARVIKILEMPNGTYTVVLNGLEKIEVGEYVSTDPYLKATVTPLRDSSVSDQHSIEFEALVDSIRDVALGLINLSPNLPKETAFPIKNIESKQGMITFICTNLDFADEDKQALLEAPGLLARCSKHSTSMRMTLVFRMS